MPEFFFFFVKFLENDFFVVVFFREAFALLPSKRFAVNYIYIETHLVVVGEV